MTWILTKIGPLNPTHGENTTDTWKLIMGIELGTSESTTHPNPPSTK